MRDREREAETQAREKQAPCREPNMGLDPRSPGSHPGLKATPSCCATGAALETDFLKLLFYSFDPFYSEQSSIN